MKPSNYVVLTILGVVVVAAGGFVIYSQLNAGAPTPTPPTGAGVNVAQPHQAQPPQQPNVFGLVGQAANLAQQAWPLIDDTLFRLFGGF